ncbi:hypothetical protein PCIT_a0011 [Pseudoalteromonas citrea]|uniref:Uncharacterized protein n=1 Tax=Pseudoalteromonas citrea TaxID=43655 RepID=A0AAD4AKA0_9GAMM|nr:hypothetical protein PCIT_a0011 [Pseudoalteromonas citrea]
MFRASKNKTKLLSKIKNKRRRGSKGVKTKKQGLSDKSLKQGTKRKIMSI